MSNRPDPKPREGEIGIVFEVPPDAVESVIEAFRGTGFAVGPHAGGPASGWTRLKASVARRDFDHAEIRRAEASFDAIWARTRFTCRRIGTDVWAASGGGDGAAGVREPRRPRPRMSDGAAVLVGFGASGKV